MEKTSKDFGVCLNCGSTEYIPDYPTQGKQICVKCGHESERIKLKIIIAEEEISDNCPFCGKEGEEDDTLLNKDDIVVFKCKRCGKLGGYRWVDPKDDYGYGFLHGAYDPLTIEIAKQEGKYARSTAWYKRVADAWRREEKDPLQRRKRQLKSLIEEKTCELQNAGINPETIRMARWEVEIFMRERGPMTQKQIVTILAAALSLIQKSDIIRHKKSVKKKVTDSQLETILNVTRKTIRKWRKILREHSHSFRGQKFGVLVRKVDGSTEWATRKIPNEVEFLIELEEPHKDKCDFCLKPKPISARLQFIDSSWSEVCQSCIDHACRFLRENQVHHQ